MAKQLADGSVVVRTPGTRAYPTGGSGATKVRVPGTRAGGGSGVGGRAAAVRTNQPGRKAAGRSALS